MFQGKSRGAAVTYGSFPQLVISFDQYHTPSAFEQAIDKSAWIGGKRRIDRALERAASVLAGGRPTSPKLVVLLTNGNQVNYCSFKNAYCGILLRVIRRTNYNVFLIFENIV